MRLFHSSFEQLSILEPRLGESRHKGEDPRAVGKAVVYLTTSADEIFSHKGIIIPYKYIVEIDENDTYLFLDEKDFEFNQDCNRDYEDLQDDTKWYFSFRSIKVMETLEWDGVKYVKRPNF